VDPKKFTAFNVLEDPELRQGKKKERPPAMSSRDV
jgi:glutaredoxin-related protein